MSQWRLKALSYHPASPFVATFLATKLLVIIVVIVETTSDLTSIQNGNGKRQMSSNGRYSFSINRKGLICSNVVLINSQRN